MKRTLALSLKKAAPIIIYPMKRTLTLSLKKAAPIIIHRVKRILVLSLDKAAPLTTPFITHRMRRHPASKVAVQARACMAGTIQTTTQSTLRQGAARAHPASLFTRRAAAMPQDSSRVLHRSQLHRRVASAMSASA